MNIIMECISISHKTAKSADRQKCYIAKDRLANFRREVMSLEQVEQCVVLSTCNRTEIYVQGETNCFKELENILATAADSDRAWIRGMVRRYQGKKAIRHLFRIACGMESMVIGEDEILGQVREAYSASQEAGCTAYEMNTVFQAALAFAKRVKTETMLSKTSISVATLAANEVFRLPIAHKTVLLIGSSGQMGGIILKDLLSRDKIRVIATVRSHNGIYQSSSPQVEHVDYRNRYDYLDQADAVISATSSPHYTLTASGVREAVKSAKERLFLDISMPPDMDEDIAAIEGCRLVGLDAINGLAKENNRLKLQAVADAQELLEEDLEKVCKTLAFHRFTAADAGWQARYAAWPAEKMVYLLRDELDCASFEAVLAALHKEGSKAPRI